MVKYVLVSDPTLSRDYRSFPLLDFLPCAPTRYVPTWLYEFLAGPQLPHDNGRAVFAPYAVRKVEPSLLSRHSADDVVVADPEYAHLFIRDDTEIIGIHAMDPAGLGPVTRMFTNGRSFTSIEENIFTKFVSNLHNEHFRKMWSIDPEHIFVTRAPFKKQFPLLNEIPTIKGATVKRVVEVMRGCGIGCSSPTK